MADNSGLDIPARQRPSLASLDDAQLQDLLLAMYKIQRLDPSDKDSFFYLGSIHGLGPAGNTTVYCHHRTVLFPSWHRPYMLAFEQALRNQLPEDRKNAFALPYWDQASEESMKNGVPDIFLVEKVTINGIGEVDNPLKSYTFQTDVIQGKDIVIAKGDKTGRGFGWIQDHAKWLQLYKANTSTAVRTIVAPGLDRCLKTPDWAHFSNTFDESRPSHSIESPHNYVHNYCGGLPLTSAVDWNLYAPTPIPRNSQELVETPTFKKLDPDSQADYQSKYDANPKLHAYLWTEISAIAAPLVASTLAYPDISSFDPLFWFHHSNVERYFWQWQVDHSDVKEFAAPDPATAPWVSSSVQRDFQVGTLFTMDTPLLPYQDTSRSVWDIKKLTYSYPSVHPAPPHVLENEALSVVTSFNMSDEALRGKALKVVHVVNKATGEIIGSGFPFVRTNPSTCPNCQVNPMVTLHVPIAPGPPIPIAHVHEAAIAGGAAMMHMEDPVDVWPPPFDVFVNGIKQ